MAQLVLTVVGDDRAGPRQRPRAGRVGRRRQLGQSELAELAGAFAGIVLVTVPDDRVGSSPSVAEPRRPASRHGARRRRLDPSPATRPAPERPDTLSFTVLGNDRPGIVRDVTTAIAAHALSIDAFRSRTLEAPMAGGTLFEASVSVSVPRGVDAEAITAALEALAGEIQVDLTVG
ncbi:MAG: ACT domain-containing protein [Microbacterium sp.]